MIQDDILEIFNVSFLFSYKYYKIKTLEVYSKVYVFTDTRK